MPKSSPLTRWHERSFSAGARWASNHGVGAAVVTYALCTVVIALSLGQAVSHWHGARSAVSVTAGLAVGVALNLRVGRRVRRSAASDSAIEICSFLGALAVIPTLVFVQVAEPGPVLGVTQGLADGYLAGQFAVMIGFVDTPK
jgi:hypothetical protein